MHNPLYAKRQWKYRLLPPPYMRYVTSAIYSSVVLSSVVFSAVADSLSASVAVAVVSTALFIRKSRTFSSVA